jgi:hypothetical protein
MSIRTAGGRKSNRKKVSRSKLQAGKQELRAGEKEGGMSSRTAKRRKSTGGKCCVVEPEP